MESKDILRISFQNPTPVNDCANVRDLKILVTAINSHAEVLEKLIQEVNRIEKKIEEMEVNNADG